MPLPVHKLDKVTDDTGWETPNGYRHVLVQQSVTMLAYMDRSIYNSTTPAGIPEPRMLLGFSIHDLPILIGAAVGAAGLIIIILVAIIVWHCCRLKVRQDKAYCLDNVTPEEGSLKQGGSIVHSDSVVFLGVKPNQVSTRSIGTRTDSCQNVLTRSQSVPLKERNSEPQMTSKRRPLSQPVHLAPLSSPLPSIPYSSPRIYPHQMPERLDYYATLGLPSIPEVAFRSSESLADIPPLSQCASCNALDEPCLYSSLYPMNPDATLKTRSLPTWGRSRPRPLSTEDDLNELYAKVSFSKKRKNRMRNDSAAAIAVNKSRSTFLTIPFSHKDTDSLVDNEAVVVYDERTAL